ncbi:MAG: 3-hydroxyisobutyrate dehydrogenase [Labilithrix sp.]|nr:3-hydroxyisobutyrate dehydrogenase [Labilithrix sp.]
MRVAFIGLGNMGRPMAHNLRRAGVDVVGFDVSTEARARAAADGLALAASSHDAARGADVVISMLPAGEHVESLYLGEDGVLARLGRGGLIVDCSTIAPSTARRISEAALARGIGCIDAPVSGGTAGAAAATLTFMVGGAAADVERARAVLEKMGKNVFYAGGTGAGQATKICNNMLLAILMIGTSEALALGAANGLDPKVLSEIMKKSSGGNWVLEKYNPVPGVMEASPASNGYAGGFGTDLMLKDLGLALDAAVSARAATPLGGLARSLYAAHSLAGHGALDFSSIVRLVGDVEG